MQAFFLSAASAEHVMLAGLALAEVDHDVGYRLACFVGAFPENELAGAEVVQDFAGWCSAASFAKFAVFFEPTILIVGSPRHATVADALE